MDIRQNNVCRTFWVLKKSQFSYFVHGMCELEHEYIAINESKTIHYRWNFCCEIIFQEINNFQIIERMNQSNFPHMICTQQKRAQIVVCR